MTSLNSKVCGKEKTCGVRDPEEKTVGVSYRARLKALGEVKRDHLVLGSVEVGLEVEDRAVVGDIVIGGLKIIHHLDEAKALGDPVVGALGNVELVDRIGGLGDAHQNVVTIVTDTRPAHPGWVLRSLKHQGILGLVSPHKVVVHLLMNICVRLCASLLNSKGLGLGITLPNGGIGEKKEICGEENWRYAVEEALLVVSPREPGELDPLQPVRKLVEVRHPLDVHSGPVRACLADCVGQEVAGLGQGIGVQGGSPVSGEGLWVQKDLGLGVKGSLLEQR